MLLTSIILGPVITEKAELLKAANTYVIKVHPQATKIDVKNALKKFYDVDVASIRVLHTVPKRRAVSQHMSIEKRHRSKRMIVRLGKKSKSLDLSTFIAA